jgi:hypothetical protein
VVSISARRGGWPRLPLDGPALAALALGAAGVGYRLVLLLLGVPGTNSDEAVFGLAAMHIAQGRAAPIYMYGQHYMGAVESYLAAPLFAAFEPSWLLLRIPVLALYAVFVVLMHRMTRRLYSPWFAVLVVGLLALGSERVVRDQVTAVGGRPESKPAVVALLLIAVALGERRLRRRTLALGAFGLLAGLVVWDDWLVLPYLAVAGLVLLAGAGRDLVGRGGALAVAGFVLGVLPLILDNLTAPPGQDSLTVFRQLNEAGAGQTTPAAQVRGAMLVGLPLATGLCPADGCAPWQAAWGVLYPLLLLAAAVLALAGLRRGEPPTGGPGRVDTRPPHPPGPSGVPQRAWRVRYAAQLALVVAAGVTVLAYARSPAAGLTPDESARYLTVLQISLPAALWPLWLASATARRRLTTATHHRAGWGLSGTAAAGVLVALTAAMLGASAEQIAKVPGIRAEEQRSRALAAAVRQAGIRHAYAEYWTCYRLVFHTGERLACAVTTDSLRPGHDRYPPYQREVAGAARPAFIFAADGAGDRAFRGHLRRHAIRASVTEAGGYRIYQPEAPVRLW